ncbi:MAG: hypothetical protein KDB07_06960 [Planctomycetes bacterium]|nr:hypothetical protein [Planctomycetota bacterium]
MTRQPLLCGEVNERIAGDLVGVYQGEQGAGRLIHILFSGGEATSDNQQFILEVLDAIQTFAPNALLTPVVVVGELKMALRFSASHSSPYCEPLFSTERLTRLQELSDDYAIIQFDHNDFDTAFLRLELIAADMVVVIGQHKIGNSLTGEGAQMLAILLTEFLASWGLCRSFEGPSPDGIEDEIQNLMLAFWSQDKDWVELTEECAETLRDRVRMYKANMGLSHEIPEEELSQLVSLHQ